MTWAGKGRNAIHGRIFSCAAYYEGGIRVPFIMDWKNRIPAGKTYRQPLVSRDISATVLAASGTAY